MKKLLSIALSLAFVVSCLLISPAKNDVTVSAAGSLPSNLVVGYWHNFDNGSTTTKLRDVNPGWDVLNVSFMMTSGDRCTAIFAPDNKIYSGTEEAMKAEFLSDVQYLQSKGKKVCISLGGETGTISLPNNAARDTFLTTATEILDTYGFDGFDVDLEGSSVTTSTGDAIGTLSSPIQVNLDYILHRLVAQFGSDFIITMAPEHPYVQGGSIGWGSPWGAYLPFLDSCRDILTWIHPQYYNNGIAYEGFSGYTVESLIGLSKMLINGFNTSAGFFEGLRPDQVAFGVPCCSRAAGSGYQSIENYQSALQSLLAEYPTFRGAMTWSTNWDETQNDAFVLGMRATIDTYGSNSLFINSVDANTDAVDVGSSVTWTASVSNIEGTASYKFDLYKDGTLVSAGTASTSSSYTAKITSAGTYSVKVTVTDSVATATATSGNVVATVGAFSIASVNQTATGLVSAGSSVTYSVDAVGGIAPYTYAFKIYKDGESYYSGSSSTSASYTLNASEPGLYTAEVTVKESGGTEMTKSFSPVFVKGALSIDSLSLSSSSVSSGASVTATVKASGGASFNEYYYYVLKDGKVVNKLIGTSNTSYTFTPSESGSYTVCVYVKDAACARASERTTLTVK